MQSNSGILIWLLNAVVKAEKESQPHKTIVAAEHQVNETSCLRPKDSDFSH